MNNSKFKFPHKFQSNEKLGSQVKQFVKDVKIGDQRLNEGIADISYDSGTNQMNIQNELQNVKSKVNDPKKKEKVFKQGLQIEKNLSRSKSRNRIHLVNQEDKNAVKKLQDQIQFMESNRRSSTEENLENKQTIQSQINKNNSKQDKQQIVKQNIQLDYKRKNKFADEKDFQFINRYKEFVQNQEKPKTLIFVNASGRNEEELRFDGTKRSHLDFSLRHDDSSKSKDNQKYFHQSEISPNSQRITNQIAEKSSSQNNSDRYYDSQIVISQCESLKQKNQIKNQVKKTQNNIPKLDLKNIQNKQEQNEKTQANNETQILQIKAQVPQQFNYESFKQFYDKENESLNELYDNFNQQLSHFSSKDFEAKPCNQQSRSKSLQPPFLDAIIKRPKNEQSQYIFPKYDQIRNSLIDLYLSVKIRSNDEIDKYDNDQLEKERIEFKNQDHYDVLKLINYIKISIEILMKMRSEDFNEEKNKILLTRKLQKPKQYCYKCKRNIKQKQGRSGRISPHSQAGQKLLLKEKSLENKSIEVNLKQKNEVVSIQTQSLKCFVKSKNEKDGPQFQNKKDNSSIILIESNQSLSSKIKSSTDFEIPSNYEKELQNYEKDLRMHIQCEQQMKLALDQLQEKQLLLANQMEQMKKTHQQEIEDLQNLIQSNLSKYEEQNEHEKKEKQRLILEMKNLNLQIVNDNKVHTEQQVLNMNKIKELQQILDRMNINHAQECQLLQMQLNKEQNTNSDLINQLKKLQTKLRSAQDSLKIQDMQERQQFKEIEKFLDEDKQKNRKILLVQNNQIQQTIYSKTFVKSDEQIQDLQLQDLNKNSYIQQSKVQPNTSKSRLNLKEKEILSTNTKANINSQTELVPEVKRETNNKSQYDVKLQALESKFTKFQNVDKKSMLTQVVRSQSDQVEKLNEIANNISNLQINFVEQNNQIQMENKSDNNQKQINQVKEQRRNNIQTRRMNALQNLYFQKLGLEDNNLNAQSLVMPTSQVAVQNTNVQTISSKEALKHIQNERYQKIQSNFFKTSQRNQSSNRQNQEITSVSNNSGFQPAIMMESQKKLTSQKFQQNSDSNAAQIYLKQLNIQFLNNNKSKEIPFQEEKKMAQISKRNVKSIMKMNNITKQKSLLQGSVNNFSNTQQNLPHGRSKSQKQQEQDLINNQHFQKEAWKEFSQEQDDQQFLSQQQTDDNQIVIIDFLEKKDQQSNDNLSKDNKAPDFDESSLDISVLNKNQSPAKKYKHFLRKKQSLLNSQNNLSNSVRNKSKNSQKEQFVQLQKNSFLDAGLQVLKFYPADQKGSDQFYNSQSEKLLKNQVTIQNQSVSQLAYTQINDQMKKSDSQKIDFHRQKSFNYSDAYGINQQKKENLSNMNSYFSIDSLNASASQNISKKQPNIADFKINRENFLTQMYGQDNLSSLQKNQKRNLKAQKILQTQTYQYKSDAQLQKLEQESSVIRKQKNQFQMYQSQQEIRNKSMQGYQQSVNVQNDNKLSQNHKLSQNTTNLKKVLNSRNKGIKQSITNPLHKLNRDQIKFESDDLYGIHNLNNTLNQKNINQISAWEPINNKKQSQNQMIQKELKETQYLGQSVEFKKDLINLDDEKVFQSNEKQKNFYSGLNNKQKKKKNEI